MRRRVPWNRLTADEGHTILRIARASTEWSRRKVVAWITDHEDVAVSEATVYRLLMPAWSKARTPDPLLAEHIRVRELDLGGVRSKTPAR